MRKKTQEEYTAQLAEKRPDIKVLETYNGDKTKIEHRCSCGEIWRAAPGKVLGGSSCDSCGIKKSGDTRRKKPDEYRAQLKRQRPDIAALESYRGALVKIKHRCSCGAEWEVIPADVLKGNCCDNCGGNKTKTPAEYEAELSLKNPDITTLQNYRGAHVKIKHRCKCGNTDWLVTPDKALHGRCCNLCSQKRAGEKMIKTPEQYKTELAVKRPGIKALEDYQGARIRINHRCTCGEVWNVTPGSVLSGHNCTQCAASGFKADQPAVLYVLHCKKLHKGQQEDCYKLGITIIKKGQTAEQAVQDRYKNEQAWQNGWKIVHTTQYKHGADAKIFETNYKQSHKSQLLTVHAPDMPQLFKHTGFAEIYSVKPEFIDPNFIPIAVSNQKKVKIAKAVK